jgi:tRNA-splicing ligase RtcB
VNCAINYAFSNRQVIGHLVRRAFAKVFPDAELKLLYDVGHNTVKKEKHEINGKKKDVFVHRKGATRAFGPGREELPKEYRSAGQPVIIGGTMGTASYVLAGTEEGMSRAFGSACHGAGRTMSRTQATKNWRGQDVLKELETKGIIVRAHSYEGVAEEAPGAYKDVSEVVDACHNALLAKKVVRVRPLGCVKG